MCVCAAVPPLTEPRPYHELIKSAQMVSFIHRISSDHALTQPLLQTLKFYDLYVGTLGTFYSPLFYTVPPM